MINIAKEDLSILVTGSILAQSQGSGTGSYGASAEHATTAHIYRVPDGTKLAADISGGMLDPMLHYNVEELARAFGSEVDQIRKRSGVFGLKANGPAPTVSDIIAQAKDLDGMGFPDPQRELSQRSGWSMVRAKIGCLENQFMLTPGDSVIGSTIGSDWVHSRQKRYRRRNHETNRGRGISGVLRRTSHISKWQRLTMAPRLSRHHCFSMRNHAARSCATSVLQGRSALHTGASAYDC